MMLKVDSSTDMMKAVVDHSTLPRTTRRPASQDRFARNPTPVPNPWYSHFTPPCQCNTPKLIDTEFESKSNTSKPEKTRPACFETRKEFLRRPPAS